MNTESYVFLGIVFFLGLVLGWFCRKGNIIMMFIGIAIFAPLLDFIMAANVWFLTVPFVLGFLVHTAKPLYKKFTS